MRGRFSKKLIMMTMIAILMVINICVFAIRIVHAEEEASINAKPVLEGILEKYINYSVSGDDKGTLVQYHLRTGIEYEEESEMFSMKENETTIQIGQIDGKYPYKVETLINRTEVTNGNVEIDKNSHSEYHPDTGVLTIKTTNQDENGNIISDEKPDNDKRDEYIIICYYDTYTEQQIEREIDLKVSYKMSLFSNENKEIYGQGELKNKVSENIGDLTSIHYDTEDIYNGYIKSNIINGTEYHTQYREIEKINISKKEAHQNIEIREGNTFVNTDGDEVVRDIGNNGNLTYKSTKFEKDNLTKLLGEEGSIQILDINGNILATIDKNTQFAEDGTITIFYENAIENLVIQTSDILSEGTLYMEHTKEIKNTMKDAENVKVKTTTNIIGMNKEIVPGEGDNEENQVVKKEVYAKENENLVEIKNAQNNVNMTVSSTEWTNKQQNEIIFDISLDSNSIKNNLFKDTILKIQLPSQVEKVILGNSSIVYGNGLALQEPYTETDENGNISIIANLSGAQTQYDESNLGLITDVKISATIILKKDIENATDKLSLVYTNNYTLDGNIEEGNVEIPLQIKSYTAEENPIEEMMQNVNLSTQDTPQDVIDSLKMEVTPVKGDVTLNDGDIVYEGEFIKYNIKVTNISDTAIENVKVVASIPEGLIYGELEADYYHYNGNYTYHFDSSVKEKNIDIGKIEAGKTYETFYEVQVQDLANEENQKEIVSTIKTYVGETETTNYEITNIIEPSDVKIFLDAKLDNGNNRWNYGVQLTGKTGDEVTVQIKLPEEFRIKWLAYNDDVLMEIPNDMATVSEDNVVTAKLIIGEAPKYLFEGYLEDDAIDKNTSEGIKTIIATATASIDGKVYTANENRIEYEYRNATIMMTSPTEGQEIHYGDEIEYDIAITNVGGANSISSHEKAIAVHLTDFLPTDVIPVSMTYETWEQETNTDDNESGTTAIPDGELVKHEITLDISNALEDQDGNKLPNVDIICNIPYDETAHIKIMATAGYVFEDTKIENNATITVTETMIEGQEETEKMILNKTSNTITHTIISEANIEPNDPDGPDNPDDPDNPNNPDDPDNPDNPSEKNYTISGVAWVDSNEDGARQSTEKTLGNIRVILVNMQKANTIDAETITAENGTYQFTNLDTGNYMVLFVYDNANYTVTEYKKNGVSEKINSDVSEQEITLLGDRVTVAATDVLQLSNRMANIDMGLVENKLFDLSLNKSISKVTVQTNQRTSTYGYENAQLAKIDIRAKEIEGAKVTVEYKLTVTNEGELEASVGSVVDYLPEGFMLDTTSGQLWRNQGNNTVINASMQNQKLTAGESITLTLTATKTMTGDSTGIFINKAEIAEASNAKQIADIDSTPGNGIETEDDFSKAEIIISIGTGIGVYISIGIILAVLVGIALFIGIKKGKININKFSKVSKLSIFAILFITMICVQETKSIAIQGVYVPSTATFTFDGGYNGTHFSGGPFGEGHCDNIGTNNQDMYPPYYKTYDLYSENATVTSETITSTGSISLSKGASNVTMIKLDDQYYILGPFIINCSNSNGYAFQVKDRNNQTVSGVSTCNSNGDSITVAGNATFYLKVPANACETGISLVKATNTAEVTQTKKQTIWVDALYTPNVITGAQKVSTGGYVYKEITTTTTASASVEWKDFNGALEIIKQDTDDSSIVLSGVQIRIQNEATGYDETFTTDENGKIHVDNLSVGTYKIIELSNNNYGYADVEQGETAIYSGMVKEYVLKNTKQTGNLTIRKKDADNESTKIQGISFRIRKFESDEDEEALAGFIEGKGDVNNNGYLGEDDLRLIIRYVTENEDLTAEQLEQADVNDDGEVNIIDMRLLMRKIQSEGYVVGMQNDSSGNLIPITTATGTVHFDNMTTTNNPEEATTFITDEEGMIQIYNILTGSYVVEEISVGDNFGYDVDPNFIMWEISNSDGTITNVNQSTSSTIEITRQTSTDTSFTEETEEITQQNASEMTVKNRRKFIKIRGFAWEDMVEADKEGLKDYVWNDGTEDKKLANVIVRLKNADGETIAEKMTDTNGEYVFGNYDEDENAVKIEIDDLVGAYIEFEYNGMSYQSIDVNSEFITQQEVSADGINTITKLTGNTNKATDSALREQFNDNYATISQGIASNTNGDKTYDIQYNYNTEIHQSSVIYGDNVLYGYEGQTYPISGVYEQYTLQAVTAQSETNALCTKLTPETIRQQSVEEIGGLNLGLEQRLMPDLAIKQDIQDVQISLNDYTHTYEYAQRFNNPDEYAGGDPFMNASVKFANKYLENSYSREVYASDVVYNRQPDNEGNLKMFITYKIELRNEASDIYSNLKALANYYDERYENVVVRDENGEIVESQTDNEYNQNGMKKMNIQLNYLIPHGQTRELTITYQLNNDAINAILNGEITLDSITEITSYSTFSDSDYRVPYAGIDVDSAPDTVNPTDILGTIEDDTDRAPSLIVKLKEERVIQGKVWEDSAIQELLEQSGYNKERKGNGIYETDENVISNVTVDLMTLAENAEGEAVYELATLYQLDGFNEVTAEARTTTNNQGEYSFSGVIPSNYIVRYTYGDNSIICDPQGNVLENVNVDNYKATIYRGGNKDAVNAMTDYWYRGETSGVEGAQRLSDAEDTSGVMEDGTRIDDIVQNRNTEDEINYETATQSRGLTEISADTRMFDIKLEYDINLDNISKYGVELKFVFDNIDFGIIERPRQSLSVDKQVGNVQILLANGATIIDGDPRSQNLSGVKVLDDDVFIEIDNEIIQGATLKVTYEIKVDNTSCEIDYNDEDYYIYGTVPSGNNNWKIATVVDMFDYLPEDVVLESNEGNNWERIYITDDMEGTVLSEQVFKTVEGLQNILHLKNPIFENMVPGSEAVDTSMVVSKQLSTTTDDLTYENDVEIIKLKGRKIIGSIPGNYDPSTNTPNEPDNNDVEVTITGPTGENRQYVLYGIIGISVLIIVGVGIVIIKRKVLKK